MKAGVNIKMSFLQTTTAKRREMILKGPIIPTMFFLSLPMIMMGMVQSIIPLIDGLFINNLVGVNAAGAIAYSAPMIMLMISVAQGLGVAGMAIIGQLNGRGESKQARFIATQIVVLAVIVGLLMVPILAIMAFAVSKYINSQMSQDLLLYMSLSSLVIPFQFLGVTYNAIKNASGKPEAPFIRMVIMLILKLAFNTLFIGVFRLGIIGSVSATLLANLIICIWMYYEMFIKKGEDKLTLRGFKFDFDVIKQLFKIGIPLMISSAMMNLCFILINNEVEKYGSATMAGQGIANNITTICFNVPSSIGGAVTAMVSMNIGAGQGEKAKKSCFVGTVMGVVSALILIAIVVPSSHYLIILFTRQADVLYYANSFLNIYIYSVVGFAIFSAQIGALNGMGRTVMPLLFNIMRVWLFRYLFILATERYLGVFAVFWGNLFSNLTCAVITTIIFISLKWVSALPQSSNMTEEKP